MIETSNYTMKTQQMREARERLTEEFVDMLQMSPDDGVRWTGTMRDLMEAAHVAYIYGTLRDDEGALCTFRSIAARACSVLHVRMPRNPSIVAYQGAQRKGVRRRPFIDRYAMRLFCAGVERPLAGMMERMDAGQNG